MIALAIGTSYPLTKSPRQRECSQSSLQGPETGVWERIFQQLAAEADNEYAMIHSTIVHAHQHSAGAKKKPALIRLSGGRAAG